jgi:hypothetical protein
MKVIIEISHNGDGAEKNKMIIEDKSIYIYPLYECPEDATLERDMISGQEIFGYMKLAHEAGLKGEKLELELVEKN